MYENAGGEAVTETVARDTQISGGLISFVMRFTNSLTLSDFAGLFILILLISFCLSYDRLIATYRKQQRTEQARAKRERRLKRAFDSKKKTSFFLYSLLSRMPVVAGAVQFLQTGYLNIVPYGPMALKAKVSSAVLILSLVSIASGAVAFMENMFASGGRIDYWGILCTISALYVAVSEVSFGLLNKSSHECKTESHVYMQNVVHHYSISKNMDMALLDAAEDMSFEMRCHANQLNDMISAENADDLLYEYVNNRELDAEMRLFATQVYKVARSGDVRRDGKSLFNQNVEKIRKKQMNDIRVSEEKIDATTGYTFSLWLGVFAMNWIKLAALKFDSTLSSFYASYGLVIEITTLLLTFVLYRMVNRSKYIVTRRVVRDGGVWERIGNLKVLKRVFRSNINDESRLKRALIRTGINISPRAFITKCVVIGLVGTFVLVFLISKGHIAKKAENLTVVKREGEITMVTESQRKSLNAAILILVNKYKDYDMDIVVDEKLMLEIDGMVSVKNRNAKEAAVRLVREQVVDYQNEFFMWYEIFISLLGMVSGMIPVIELMYYDRLTRGEKEDEIRTFQMIASIEKDLPGVKIIDILTEWESHSVLYSDKLRKAILRYSANPHEALTELYDPESLSFSILVDSLIAADVIGIREAFAELDVNMENDEAMRIARDGQKDRKRRSIMEILCYVPFGMAVGVYFLVPFMASVAGDIGGALEMMQGMKGGGFGA